MRFFAWGIAVLCLPASCAPRSQAELAMPGAVETVDVEASRVRALAAFDPRCAHGALACDGAITSSPGSNNVPPAGAAGFDFGMTDGDAERHCRGAGEMWSSQARDAFSCSGSAGARLPFHVDVFTRGGHVCRIVLSQRAAGNRFVDVEHELRGKYGSASFSNATGASWRWDSGYALSATLERAGRDTFLFIAYSSPTFGDTVRTRGL